MDLKNKDDRHSEVSTIMYKVAHVLITRESLKAERAQLETEREKLCADINTKIDALSTKIEANYTEEDNVVAEMQALTDKIAGVVVDNGVFPKNISDSDFTDLFYKYGFNKIQIIGALRRDLARTEDLCTLKGMVEDFATRKGVTFLK